MVCDRGSNFTAAFDAVLADADIRTMRCNFTSSFHDELSAERIRILASWSAACSAASSSRKTR